MTTPQIVLFVIGSIVFLAAFVFYFKANNFAGSFAIMVGFVLCLLAGVGPSSIEDLKFISSEVGMEFSLSRNVYSEEQRDVMLTAERKLNEGVTSKKIDKIVEESENVPDAKRSAEDFMILATSSWKSGDYIDGIAYAQQGLRLEPKDVRIKAALLNRMGALLADIGDKVRAEEFYQKSIRADSTYSWPHNNLGVLLHDLKRYDEAEDAYRKAIKIDLKEAMAHNNLGVLLHELTRYEEAEEAYRKAIGIDPKDAEAHYNLGSLLIDLKRYDEAEDAYQKATEIDPQIANGKNVHERLLKERHRGPRPPVVTW